MPDTEAKIRVSTEGTDESEAKLKKVAGAQQEVVKLGGKSTEQADKQDDAQEKLTATVGDYVEILRKINPQLGEYFHGMMKGSKIAGDLASQQISLTGALGKAGQAIQANAGMLKLLGAGGVAAIGFGMLAKSIAAVREESERLRKEFEALQAYHTEEEEKKIEGGQDIVAASRARREGGLTGEEQAQAEATYRQIVDNAVVRDLELLKQNIAALSGLISGQDIERLTLAGQSVDAAGHPRARRAEAEAMLRRDETQEAAERERERMRAEREAQRDRALVEAQKIETDPSLGTANLDQLIARLAPGLNEAEQKEAYKVAEKLMGLRGEDFAEGRTRGDVGEREEVDRRMRGWYTWFSDPNMAYDRTGATTQALDAGKKIADALKPAMDRQNEAADGHKEAAEALQRAAAALERAAANAMGNPSFSGPDSLSGRRQGGAHRRDEAGY